MNRGPRASGAPSSGATEIFLGKTLRKNRCCHQILRLKLKCTKFEFGCRGSAPDPAGGAYSSASDTLAGFGGRFAAEGRGWAGEEEREGKGREGEVEEREREGPKLLLNQGPSEPCYATGYNTRT